MASYRDRMADTLIADMRRREQREQDELRSLGLLDSDYCHSRNITGEPSEKNRVYRASDDCWKRGLRSRTVGTVTDDGIATVAVTYANGATVIRTAASFKKENLHKKQRVHAYHVAEATHRVTCADLAPIGNID